MNKGLPNYQTEIWQASIVFKLQNQARKQWERPLPPEEQLREATIFAEPIEITSGFT